MWAHPPADAIACQIGKAPDLIGGRIAAGNGRGSLETIIYPERSVKRACRRPAGSGSFLDPNERVPGSR